jgi:glycosyltransferase involved in cell wall biosynthesis
MAWRMRRPGIRGTLWQLFYLAEAVVLADSCQRSGIRHVHAHFANVASDVAMLARAVGDDSWSWSFTVHGASDLLDIKGQRIPDKAADAAFVVCISDFARSQLMAVTAAEVWPRLHVVRCGLVSRGTQARPPRGAIGTAERPAQILNVGRLTPVKGQLLLIDLAKALRERGRSFELTIVGDGPQSGALERAISGAGLNGHIRLAGALGQDRVAELYAQADLFVLPSFLEGIPVVAMEAMAAGVPVVATRVAGIPELVEDRRSGRLVTPGRADELIDAVDELLTDDELRAGCSRRASTAVRERFDVDAEAARLARLFDATC